jgi:hypothetical protein
MSSSSGLTIGGIPGLPEALATVKEAAARTNASLGLLSPESPLALARGLTAEPSAPDA